MSTAIQARTRCSALFWGRMNERARPKTRGPSALVRGLGASAALVVCLLAARPAEAQYAIGHRFFGAGTSMGIGYERMQLPTFDVGASRLAYLLPTIELKLFPMDTLSIDISVPVANIAASNAIRDYFLFTGEAYVNFHPSAPAQWELFIAPGIGFSYAHQSFDNAGVTEDHELLLFHIPTRIGMEYQFDRRRHFSVFIAARPFFSLAHSPGGPTRPGGGALLEIGFMGYTVRYRGDRY